MQSDTDGGPPTPPSFRAKVVLTRKQLFGLPVLFAIPLIALAGLLGESTGHVVASASQLELSVDFPSRGNVVVAGRAHFRHQPPESTSRPGARGDADGAGAGAGAGA